MKIHISKAIKASSSILLSASLLLALFGCSSATISPGKTEAEKAFEKAEIQHEKAIEEQAEVDKINKVATLKFDEHLQETIQFQQLSEVSGLAFMAEDEERAQLAKEEGFRLSELDRFTIGQKIEELITDDLFTVTLNQPDIQTIGYNEDLTKFTYYPLDEETTLMPESTSHLKYAILYHLFLENSIDDLVFIEVQNDGEEEIPLRTVAAADVYEEMLSNGH